MSFALTQKLLRMPLKVSANEKMVLVILSDMIDDKGYCWITHENLGGRLGLSERSSERIVSGLKKKRLLIVGNKFKNANKYTINFDALPPYMVKVPAKSGEVTTKSGGLIDNRINKGIDKFLSDSDEITFNPTKENPMHSVEDIKKEIDTTGSIGKLKQVKNKPLYSIWQKEMIQWKEENDISVGRVDVLKKDQIILKQTMKKCGGHDPIAVLKNTIRKWDAFGVYCKSQEGLKSFPDKPVVGVYVKYIDTATDFFSKSDIKCKPKKLKLKVKKKIEIDHDKPISKTKKMLMDMKAQGLLK